jgi:putative nucleotidyltransferase with HDIG domain
LKVTLNIVLQYTLSQLGVDASAILLFKPHLQTIEYEASRGFRSSDIQHAELKLSEAYANPVVSERRTVHLADFMKAGHKPAQAKQLAKEGFVDYYGTPLIVKGEIKGVLEIYHRSPLMLNIEQLEFFETLAGQAAIAIDSAQLVNSLQQAHNNLIMAYDATIMGWSRAMDLRDQDSQGHAQRVTTMTLKLARHMGVSDADLVHMRRGALLHDIGKIGVPDALLLKTEPLTKEEWEKMRKHPEFAYELLSSIGYLQPALDIPYCHHENWDGSGYPRGLKGEEIPLAARIFAVADVWDVITSDRPHRRGMPKEQALDYIREQCGKALDPEVVKIFLELFSA